MNIAEIKQRVSARLNICTLNDMQQAMSEVQLPTRLLLLAPTGSGKTWAFAIPVLRSLGKKGGGVSALVIAPTRELVLQIFEVLRTLAAPEYKATACYGGHSVEAEVNSLEASPDIIVATPGRLLDHIRRGHLSLYSVHTLVLDEYDKSLELGFQEEMRAIVGRLKNVRSLLLTSATESPEIPSFIGSDKFEVFDYIGTGASALDIWRVPSPTADKLDTLDRLLRGLGGRKAIVFVNHRDAAERIFGHLKNMGYPVGIYHGGMEQNMREQALILFENGSTRVLVATDLASRGLDIASVEAIVHYHLPPTAENWTHRNGRTARMGAGGEAYVIISDADKVPDYVDWSADYEPVSSESSGIEPVQWRTLYFNAGKKEKISKGDIAGFLMQKGGLSKNEVGRIDVRDHGAYVAVPLSKARDVITALAPHKIKNKRVRVTQVK